MDFPRFKTPDGEDLIVNPDRIDAVTNRAGKTSIVVSGVAHVVDGTVDDVLAILGGDPMDGNIPQDGEKEDAE